jgi:hypothetical protein
MKTSLNNTGQNEELRQRNKEKKRLIDYFNFDINYMLYPMIKYFIDMKEKVPFFNDMIAEIIMVIPIKPIFLNEIPHLIFPSLVDNLINGNDNTQSNLVNLENFINAYHIKSPESVLPFVDQNMPKISDFLSENLLRPISTNTCLASLKWLSKLGGKGRNFFGEKKNYDKNLPDSNT